MNFDFPLILLILTVFTGVASLSYRLLFHGNKTEKKPILIEYCRSFFPLFLIVLILRSFVIQPYSVPTGSLEPTILPGELLFANQFQYGLRLPVWRNTVLNINGAKRGQIVLFHDPVNPDVLLIKRLIGLPGDRISYVDKVLYINGKKMEQTEVGPTVDIEGNQNIPVTQYQENLDGVKHDIIINKQAPAQNFYNVVVPEGQYFAMGDNRDNSDDSRYWGFIPAKNLVGKGLMIILSWNQYPKHWYDKIRWNRIGTVL